MMIENTFANRLDALAHKRTRFCLGLDPTPQLLLQWGFENSVDGLKAFIDTTLPLCEQLAIVKPQVAFYEQFGPQGLLLLQQYTQQIQETGTLVLLDCKKGDISHTMTAYTKAYVGKDSPYAADAMTLTAYLGVEALADSFSHIAQADGAAFVVVHSSNIEGRQIQQAVTAERLTVASAVAKCMAEFNQQLAPTSSIGPIGAVVGATAEAADLEPLLPYLKQSLLLTPGLGKQGATFADLASKFAGYTQQIIPTSSRAVLEHGPNRQKLCDAIAREQDLAAQLI